MRRKGTFGVQSSYPRATVFQVASASWLIDFWMPKGAESAQEFQPPEWGKQRIVMYLARNHQSSERSWLGNGRRLRADGTAARSLLHTLAQGKGAGRQSLHFSKGQGKPLGDPGQGSVLFDGSLIRGTPKVLCHFNMVPGIQSEQWIVIRWCNKPVIRNSF